MSWTPRILVVAPTPSVAGKVFAWLTDAGCGVTVVDSFASAKRQLEHDPCLLISEIRLGDYNGLHLALRAQARGIPSILIGHPDPVLERDAQQIGAIYLSELNAQRFCAIAKPLALAGEPGPSHTSSVATNISFISSAQADASVAVREPASLARRRSQYC